jgi:hypothetical protein
MLAGFSPLWLSGSELIPSFDIAALMSGLTPKIIIHYQSNTLKLKEIK